MNATVTATVTIEVNGQKLVLTHADAQELLGALTVALAPSLAPTPRPWAPYHPPYHIGGAVFPNGGVVLATCGGALTHSGLRQ